MTATKQLGSPASKHRTELMVDQRLPTIELVRDFDAPVDRVYRAWVDPVLVAQWMGPRSVDMVIETWDCRTGGEYRYTAVRDGEEIAHFYGSFHQVRENERLVQTFGFDEMPDAVSLDIATFEDLGGRTRVRILSVLESFEARDGVLASGMDTGVTEGYERLDQLLASA
jgi:uncharacterized protein YndB with AHSA1/START domain